MGDYVILEEDSSSDLQKQVNEYIEMGYKPVGGVMVSQVNVDPAGLFGLNTIEEKYTQGMIKD